ncbi:MAG TPA: OmpH family outer membrane protein [Allosphingosinicella sp.]|jgi:Skp family chaperone for outer membrane proteins|nr:OmpH family outer membrane protein [Allosphingosinicella sp.]
MKTKLLLAAALVAAVPTAGMAQQRAAPASILVVDTNRVLRECTACVAATAALQAQEATFQQRGQALTGPLQTEQQSIQQAVQAASALTGTARTNAENALRPRIQAFQQRQQTAEQELRTLQQNFESTRVHVSLQLNQRLQPIFTQIMNARGANLVISTDARLASAPTLDITSEVLAQLNRAAPSVSVTPLPPQQGAGQPGQQPRPQQPRPQQPRPGDR